MPINTSGFSFRSMRMLPSVPTVFPPPELSEKYPEFGSRVVRLPEREMRRKGEHAQHAIAQARAAKLHEAKTCRSEQGQIVRGVNEWQRVRGTSRGARHQDRTKLSLDARVDARPVRAEAARKWSPDGARVVVDRER